MIDIDVEASQYCLFPGEDKYSLIAIKLWSCHVKS